MVLHSQDRLIDIDTQFSDGATVHTTVDGFAQVGGADKTIDLGGDARMQGDIVIEVLTTSATSGDGFKLRLLGSNDATPFGTNIVLLGTSEFGHAGQLGAIVTDTKGPGRYTWPVENSGMADGLISYFRHLRLHVDVTGATQSTTFRAYLVPRR